MLGSMTLQQRKFDQANALMDREKAADSTPWWMWVLVLAWRTDGSQGIKSSKKLRQDRDDNARVVLRTGSLTDSQMQAKVGKKLSPGSFGARELCHEAEVRHRGVSVGEVTQHPPCTSQLE